MVLGKLLHQGAVGWVGRMRKMGLINRDAATVSGDLDTSRVDRGKPVVVTGWGFEKETGKACVQVMLVAGILEPILMFAQHLQVAGKFGNNPGGPGAGCDNHSIGRVMFIVGRDLHSRFIRLPMTNGLSVMTMGGGLGCQSQMVGNAGFDA